MRLIVATRNKSKLKEIKKILKGIKMPILSLADLDQKFRIVENGKTFLANAKKKAVSVSKIYREDLVLGEDSGIEVDYLDGRPGIYSKRYAGKEGSSLKNNAKLLKALEHVPCQKRGAQFHCCLVLASKGRLKKVFNGRLRGKVAKEPGGNGGFGYDPVLYLALYKKTVGQLSLGEKNKISHRAKAFKKLKEYLQAKSI